MYYLRSLATFKFSLQYDLKIALGWIASNKTCFGFSQRKSLFESLFIYCLHHQQPCFLFVWSSLWLLAISDYSIVVSNVIYSIQNGKFFCKFFFYQHSFRIARLKRTRERMSTAIRILVMVRAECEAFYSAIYLTCATLWPYRYSLAIHY